MRTFAAALLLTIAPYAISAAETCTSGTKLLDDKFGFRDVKYDTRVQDVPDLKQVPQDFYKTKRVKAYVRTGDRLQIFDQPLAAITYFFFDDRLFSIDLEWGTANPIAILHRFADAFGCELERSDGPSGQDLTLSIVGQQTKFYGSVHINRLGAYGVAVFQKRGVQKAIDEAIAKEAATQF
jgi:hypothetical protein